MKGNEIVMSTKEKAIQSGENTLSKREAAALKQKQERKKTMKLFILTIAIIVVALAISLFINSNYVRRNFCAIEIGDQKLSAAEFEFYYNEFYNRYVQYVYENQYDSASLLLPDQTKPLWQQKYYDESKTWKEYFQEYAIGNLQRYVGLYNEAKEIGFEMNDEQKASIQSRIDNLDTMASYYGLSTDKYLKGAFGNAANMEIFEKCITFLTYCEGYDEYYTETREYTDEQLNAEYESNKDRYDLYEYRYMTIFSETVNDSDYDTEEEAEAARDAAVAVSHAQAEEYMAQIKSEEDMIEIAKAYDSEKYAEDDATLRAYNGDILGSTYGPWLKEAERKEGDMAIFDYRSGTYLVYFINRSENKYETVDAITITVTPVAVAASDYENEENDDAYNAAVEQAKNDAAVEAENIEKEWLENGGTEEAFKQIAEDRVKTSARIASADVDYVYHGQFSPEIDEWMFDEARKEGDHLVAYSDNAGCYYVIYYKCRDMLYNEYLARNELQRLETNAHEEKLIEGVEYEKHWSFSKA